LSIHSLEKWRSIQRPMLKPNRGRVLTKNIVFEFLMRKPENWRVLEIKTKSHRTSKCPTIPRKVR
jgi:hypothetical protein